MVPTEKITQERLDGWAKKFSESHATPILSLGVGHDHTSGQLVLCIVDEAALDNKMIRFFLRMALRELEK
jgi:hypothetical protein